MSQEEVTEVGSLGECVGKSVTVLGWVESTRSHGKVGFVILRDGTGLVQGVLLKKELPEDTWGPVGGAHAGMFRGSQRRSTRRATRTRRI